MFKVRVVGIKAGNKRYSTLYKADGIGMQELFQNISRILTSASFTSCRIKIEKVR